MSAKLKVLVAEDESFILRSILHVLRKQGYDPLSARDGEEALARIRESRPDVVFLDVMMPRMNGYDVCRRVKDDPALAGTWVILLTAKGQQADRDQGFAAGADDYVVKPFSVKDLLDRVASRTAG